MIGRQAEGARERRFVSALLSRNRMRGDEATRMRAHPSRPV